MGTIFPTGTKENPDPVVGVDFLRAARRMTRKPLVAIGGITLESAADIFRAGADSVAIIRDLLAASDPGTRAREYLGIAERYRPRAIKRSRQATRRGQMQNETQPVSFAESRPSTELVKGLGLFDSTMIVAGSMIGSGIFIVSADIAHQVQSPALLLAVWISSGVIR